MGSEMCIRDRYRRTTDHGNADALSRLPAEEDHAFDEEEGDADVDTVCTIHTISRQLCPTDPGIVAKESSKDPVIAHVIAMVQQGSPLPSSGNASGEQLQAFRRLEDSLSTHDGCLFYGSRIVIPTSLQKQVLEILHLGHFGSCLLYTSPSPRDLSTSRMPSSA